MTNACFSYFYSFVASSSWVVGCMVDGEAASHRSPGPLVARPGARSQVPNGRPYLHLHRDTVWRANLSGVAGPGAASCRAVAGFLERALNLVPHSPPSGRCSHQLPNPAQHRQGAVLLHTIFIIITMQCYIQLINVTCILLDTISY